MEKCNVLIITGKLEILLQDDETLVAEVKNLQKYISEDDFVHFSIAFGRFSELLKGSAYNVDNYVLSLLDYISNFESSFQSEIEELNSEKQLSTYIGSLGLSTRTFNALYHANIRTIGDLVSMTSLELYRMSNIGKKSYMEIIKTLKNLGYTLNE